MAKFFIERPIFAWVVAIFIILAGIVGIKKLPITQYPSVAAPTITLRATYAGASAKVMEDSVLAVIERNMYGVDGLDYISTSADSSGSGSVTLTFTPETDEDIAQVNVQNKLSEVTPLLPATVQQNGVSVNKARSNFLLIINLSSPNPETACLISSIVLIPVDNIIGLPFDFVYFNNRKYVNIIVNLKNFGPWI